MKKLTTSVLVASALMLGGCGVGGDENLAVDSEGSSTGLQANPNGSVLAVGIPMISGIQQVGPFLDSGHDSPFYLNPLFLSYKNDGAVLDKNRLLVLTSSNFGAPLFTANNQLPGGVLSIATKTENNETIIVDQNFAASISDNNVQPSGNNGDVQLYTANADQFLNVHNRPEANTAYYGAASFPTGISINNAFGRPWISNAPFGTEGGGTSTVVDPDGKPLEALLSATSGGVFAGGLSERAVQYIEGSLTSGSLGTTFMGVAPGAGAPRADFAVANADGSIAQVHVADGIDGLAPAGTITPMQDQLDAAIDGNLSAIMHVGMAFNWIGAEGKVLYVTDPLADEIVVIPLKSNGAVFVAGQITHMDNDAFDVPIDLSPVTPEFANGDFASGTTLAAGSDMYVANYGNNTIVRIKKDGTIVDQRPVYVEGIGELTAESSQKVYGISTSWDAKRIYLSIRGVHPDYAAAGDGFVVEMDAF